MGWRRMGNSWTARWAAIALLALAPGACDEQREPPSFGAPMLVKKLAPDEAANAAAGTGVLILRDGCLALEHADRSRTLLLWPAEARLERSPDGALRVLGTPGKAQRTVRVGEQIVVGGSELGAGAADSGLVGPGRRIPATAAYPAVCAGRVWNVYSFEPATPAVAASGMVDNAALEGEWVVAEIHGSPPLGGTRVIRVTIGDGRFRAQSQCVPFWWTFVLTPGRIQTADEPYPDPVCERTLSHWEAAFKEAMGRASTIDRQPDGAMLIRGPGGQVLLRRK